MSELPKTIKPTLKDLLGLEYLAFTGALLPKRLVHNVLAGKHASKLRGRGLDFAEVRKYVAGDDIRNIDWKVTARTKTTYTKVFEEEKERPVFMVADLTSYMFFGSVAYTKSALILELAAIAGFRTLKASDRFGGILFGDQDETYIRPQRSRIALIRYLEDAVNRNNELCERTILNLSTERLNQMLKRTRASVTHDQVVVVATDMNAADEETYKHLIGLSMHNDVILVQVADPLQMVLPGAKVLMGDGVKQTLMSKNTVAKAKMEEQQQALKLQLEEKLRKYNIVSLQLSTERSAVDQLKDIFARVTV